MRRRQAQIKNGVTHALLSLDHIELIKRGKFQIIYHQLGKVQFVKEVDYIATWCIDS